MVVALGTSSCSSSKRFASSVTVKTLTPVAFPPGRLKLATRPSLTGRRSNPALDALLRRALNGDGAEFRVLVANLTGLFVFGPTAPGFCFFEAVPHLNGNAGRWWRSFK
jgi:hypothetical protein